MRLKIALVLGFTVGCLLWVLWGIDLDVVRVSLVRFKWERMIAVFLLYISTHAIRVFRFRWILGIDVPFWRLMSIVSVGYVAINVVPLRMGEFVRPYLLQEKEEVPFGAGVAAVFVERLVDMIMLLFMLLAVAFTVELPAAAIMVEGTDVLRAGQQLAGLVVLAGLTGIAVLTLAGERALRLTDRLPLGSLVRRFVEGLSGLVRRPRDLLRIFSSSIVIWLITFWSVQVSLSAFEGLPWDFGSALVVWTVTLAGMSAIPTPGFFGGFEAFCTAALVVLGVGADEARTFAVILHLGQFGFTVGWGLIFLLWEGISLRDVVGRSRAGLRAAD